ncbi:cholecystokinin receptor type A-like [Saccostrea cucullata]|uniref:cholecystokinin receptor type A-like n=1 Tax=Saccostrea cuccullata TaxID=36930 RepID=UPI002ED30F0C
MFIMNDSLIFANKTSRILDDPKLLQIANDIAVRKHLIPSLILTVLMIIIGIPGNILIIAVYMKRWRKSTSRIFILALAFNDLFNCLFTMPVELYYIINILQTDDSNLCKTSRFLTFWTNDGSSLILMGIAFDRLQRICKPFEIQLSRSTAKKIVAVSMLASLAVAWPSLLIYGTANVPITVGEYKMYAKMCLYSDNIRIDPTVFVFFIMAGNSVLDVFFLVVYGIILYHVKNAGKELRKMSQRIFTQTVYLVKCQ